MIQLIPDDVLSEYRRSRCERYVLRLCAMVGMKQWWMHVNHIAFRMHAVSYTFIVELGASCFYYVVLWNVIYLRFHPSLIAITCPDLHASDECTWHPRSSFDIAEATFSWDQWWRFPQSSVWLAWRLRRLHMRGLIGCLQPHEQHCKSCHYWSEERSDASTLYVEIAISADTILALKILIDDTTKD